MTFHTIRNAPRLPSSTGITDENHAHASQIFLSNHDRFCRRAERSTSGGRDCLANCDSGLPETWQPQVKLEEALKEKGWEIRMIKVDGGCCEVYALDENKERVEAYFHPKTLERAPIQGG